jgi:hypothetical protein
VEKLTAVTQEELDAGGIDAAMVESIQSAVNSYYSQFEAAAVEPAAVSETEPAASAESPSDAVEEAPAEPIVTTESELPEAPAEARTETASDSTITPEPAGKEALTPPPSEFSEDESGTIKNAG